MNNNLIPAATVLVLKDSDIGMEVLMVKRSKRPPFENLYVFPGGKIDENDYLIICDVGAYGMSLASNYNLRPKPLEILIKNSKIQILGKRQKLSDLM